MSEAWLGWFALGFSALVVVLMLALVAALVHSVGTSVPASEEEMQRLAREAGLIFRDEEDADGRHV